MQHATYRVGSLSTTANAVETASSACTKVWLVRFFSKQIEILFHEKLSTCKYYSTTIHSSFFILFRVYKFVSLKNTFNRLFWNDILNLKLRNNISNMMQLGLIKSKQLKSNSFYLHIFVFSTYTSLWYAYTSWWILFDLSGTNKFQ